MTQGQNRLPQPGRTSAGNVTPPTSLVRSGELDKWMYSRLTWITLGFAIAAFLVTWFYLSKLSFGSGMDVERKARRIFFVCLVFIVLPGIVAILLADMYFYWFRGADAFTLLGGLFGLQGLVLTASPLLAFTLATALTARLKPYSRCPYMLMPKPRIQ